MCDPKFEIIAMALNETYVKRTHNTPEKAVFDVFCNLKPGDCPYDNYGSRLGKNRPGVPYEPHPDGVWTSCTNFKQTSTKPAFFKKPTKPAEWLQFKELWEATQQLLQQSLGKKPSDSAVDTAVAKDYEVARQKINEWRHDPDYPK